MRFAAIKLKSSLWNGELTFYYTGAARKRPRNRKPALQKTIYKTNVLRYAGDALEVLWPRVEMELEQTSTLTRDDMECRRLQAAQDLLNGCTQSTVARKYRVSRTTASRWHRALVFKGVDSLKKRRAPGRPSRLTGDQLSEIREIYLEGPQAFGFTSKRWTTAKMATAIESRFGVRYDPDHVGRLMNRLGLGRKSGSSASVYTAAVAAYAPAPELSPILL